LVPGGGHIANELEGRLVGVSLRSVGDHLEWIEVDDVEGKLLSAGALDHGTNIARDEIGLGRVVEAAKSVPVR
jgi:hypothetical protein